MRISTCFVSWMPSRVDAQSRGLPKRGSGTFCYGTRVYDPQRGGAGTGLEPVWVRNVSGKARADVVDLLGCGYRRGEESGGGCLMFQYAG